MNLLTQFHFLRPDWLWLLLPTAFIWWRLHRQHERSGGWRKIIAPHLLPQLLTTAQESRSGVGPVVLLGVICLLGIVALAGPSWQREPSPFAEEQSVLVLVLKVTPSMLAGDVQPSRLQRAVDKIDRLLQRRSGTRVALLAYAGSAHRVMPFTRDHRLVVDFARELAPEIMPRSGDELGAALQLGDEMIAASGRPGALLVLADAVDPAQVDSLDQSLANGNRAELWAIAAGPEVVPLPGTPTAPALDEAGMRAAADAMGGTLEIISVDDRDVTAVDRRIGRQLATAGREEGTRWRDAGYYLVPVLVLLALFWFRRGWVVRWN